MTENGASFQCGFEIDRAILRCSSGAFLVRTWEYASVENFIGEASTPNRVLARIRTSSSGVSLGGFASTTTEYTYDDRGQLLERLRRGENSTGVQDTDRLRYTAWDDRGRPVAGTLTSVAGTEDLTIVYDDRLFRAEASNGESTVQDPNGNPLREVFVFGAGGTRFSVEREYTIQATAEVCR